MRANTINIARPSKEKAVSIALQFSPLCLEYLLELNKTGQRRLLPRSLASSLANLKIEDYVIYYDNERFIDRAILMALLGQEGVDGFNQECSSLPESEWTDALDELAHCAEGLEIDCFFPPKTKEDEEKAKQEFENLSAEQKADVTRRTKWFWGGFLAHFHNILSLMVHGEKLTNLVAKAKQGDKAAFCKAIQIDRSLIVEHPFFKERRLQAHQEGDEAFLRAIAYRETSPIFKGRIRYPGLYVLFAALEALNWLDDLSHEELLDACDAAGLDRYQNRIEDVNYLTKRLRSYRATQRLGGLSMP